MRQSKSDLYVDEQVENRLTGESAHLVSTGLDSGDLDLEEITPSYDVEIDEDLTDYSFSEGADPYPVVDVLEGSFLSGIRMDTDRGYFEFETSGGETAEGWMPYLDEGKARGIFEIEHPWADDTMIAGYDGLEARGEDLDGIEPMLESAYRTAREHVPDKGFRNRDISMNDLESRTKSFENAISRIESGEKVEVDGKQHVGELRGRDIVRKFTEAMDRARKANLVDYPVSNDLGNQTFEKEAGGYKKLSEFPESAPYDTIEGAIKFRYPDSWREKEQ